MIYVLNFEKIWKNDDKNEYFWRNVFIFALWINLIIIIFQRRWDKVIYY